MRSDIHFLKKKVEAGADYIGLDEFIDKIKNGWVDVDVIVTMPSVMPKLGPLGKVLGPRGLMPNQKTGTVTMDVNKAVNDAKGGQVTYRVDKKGNIHAGIGKISFDADKIKENFVTLMEVVNKAKPSSSKGRYITNAAISLTMSPSITLDTSEVMDIKAK